MTKDTRPNVTLTDWLGVSNAPNWRVARHMGPLLTVVVAVLFVLALGSAFVVLGRTVFWGGEVSLGVGGLVVALLGAPFVIWGTVLKHQTVMFQKEGHMTDRINKAVEQLGAEKTVKKHFQSSAGKKMYEKDKDGNPDYAKPVIVEESVPNIEVRIGAILSLERIAQDSTRHDKGRDHVRVMEILCAYIRENSNATPPIDHAFGEWESLKRNATEEERAAHIGKRDERFSRYGRGKVWEWAQKLPEPRADIALALKVLGRRTADQRKVEAAWPDPRTEQTIWPFDLPCPRLPDVADEQVLTQAAMETFLADMDAWKDKIGTYSGYRLDLHGVNLQRADLSAKRPDQSDAVFAGAMLTGAQLDGANLSRARLEGAHLRGAKMQGVNLDSARLKGATLRKASLEGAVLSSAEMEGTFLGMARMEGADLRGARIEGVELGFARLEVANLGGARMEGTKLFLAGLEGVDLSAARMDAGTSIDDANIKGAALRNQNLRAVAITRDQVHGTFGDASVILPERIERPDHWPAWEFPSDDIFDDFTTEWHKWQADPAGYTPPEKPQP